MNVNLEAIDHVRVEGNTNTGVSASDGSKVTVRNSVASGNRTGIGFSCDSVTKSAELNVESSVASNKFSGVVDATSFMGVCHRQGLQLM